MPATPSHPLGRGHDGPRRRVPFLFVDVFAVGPLTGNPVALVPDADDLGEEVMRAAAREFNQSETTFLLRPRRPDATWRLRSFTPIGAEVFGAGHNALGAWLWLAASGRLPGGEGEFVQEIGEDLLPVRVRAQAGRPPAVSMDQSPPRFGAAVGDPAELAAALGLAEADLVAGAPAQVVGTGADHLLVPLRARAAVDRARPDQARLAAVLASVGGEGCYLYSREPGGDGATAYARFFNPTMGIAEDPATGTAAGPLAALLVRDGAARGDVRIAQGHAAGRPSLIEVAVRGDLVTVTGSGLVVAEGTLLL
ncbi:PhzF family phenazine biosynthesis protein [Streptomyces hoynatensis]|uniref:PhzF family phenazine biosynthesis protein n=1 Tax=Streptomyces hoynatensis TaxID=1141874 RepID=A0A3A9YRD5_9ACTN|nr:PhzF family phenazine biosynthesis protein [Streptomyces hoynatensis]RKN37927.1 PhzF family phenazine biosynthesis protein [Streptomyces hoynatensis]